MGRAEGDGALEAAARVRLTAQAVLKRAPTTARRLVGDWLVIRAGLETKKLIQREEGCSVTTHPRDQRINGMDVEALRRHIEGVTSLADPALFSALASVVHPVLPGDPRSALSDLLRRAIEIGAEREYAEFLLLRLSREARSQRAWSELSRRLRTTSLVHEALLYLACLKHEEGDARGAARLPLEHLPAICWREEVLYDAFLYAASCQDSAILRELQQAVGTAPTMLLPSDEAVLRQTRCDREDWLCALRNRSFWLSMKRILPDAPGKTMEGYES